MCIEVSPYRSTNITWTIYIFNFSNQIDILKSSIHSQHPWIWRSFLKNEQFWGVVLEVASNVMLLNDIGLVLLRYLCCLLDS